jgi:predicted SAM-dependent methyltransferase
MIRYCTVAFVLKAFSCSNLTKRIYRKIGNTVGSKKRLSGRMPEYYILRINRMIGLSSRYNFPKNGDRLIELGTGWLHWEAITARLFFEVHGILFDVWDNRQMGGLKNYLQQLNNNLFKINIEKKRQDSARKLISDILKIKDYHKLYGLLGFEYVLEAKGNLISIDKNAFDLVVSAGVLEHISIDNAGVFINNISSLMKPGGHSFNSINIRDHLWQYDKQVSKKQYLRYPNKVWSVLFENEVQYINKIQRSTWLKLFDDAGLQLIEEEVELEDLKGLKLAKDFKCYSNKDVTCGGLNMVHRKPH